MSETTRSFFLGAATAAAASRVWGANDKINLAIVGLGGRGTNHLAFLFPPIPDARVAVALRHRPGRARDAPRPACRKTAARRPRRTEDMRQMFADSAVDAVSIATPNHWHALAAIWAMKAGKDVYSEKPACYNIHEGQQMIKVARETNRMLQIGSQHRSDPIKIKAMEALHGGLIGQVYMAKGLCFKRRPSIGHKPTSPRARRRQLGPLPRPRAHASLQRACASNTTGTGSGTPATAISATRACTKSASAAGAWAIPSGPKRLSPWAASTPIRTTRRRPTP